MWQTKLAIHQFLLLHCDADVVMYVHDHHIFIEKKITEIML